MSKKVAKYKNFNFFATEFKLSSVTPVKVNKNDNYDEDITCN